jgi:hypothetical protein
VFLSHSQRVYLPIKVGKQPRKQKKKDIDIGRQKEERKWNLESSNYDYTRGRRVERKPKKPIHERKKSPFLQKKMGEEHKIQPLIRERKERKVGDTAMIFPSCFLFTILDSYIKTTFFRGVQARVCTPGGGSFVYLLIFEHNVDDGGSQNKKGEEGGSETKCAIS